MADLTLEMLPAREGDCLLLSYHDPAAGLRRHVLIDGGRAGTWPHLKARLERLPANERALELLVVTHVDRDHIEGVLAMLGDPGCPVTFKDVWFNGYRHLLEDPSFGAVQGERLTALLLRGPWNEAFAGGAVCVPESGELPVRALAGGLRLTLLSPDRAKLAELLPVWEEECRAAGIAPSTAASAAAVAVDDDDDDDVSFGPPPPAADADRPFRPDTAAANGSSIALLAEYGERRVLLAADAHPDLLARSLASLGGGRPVRVDAWKVAHHGSANNTSTELLRLVSCPRYLISTSGAYFKHPSGAAIARILRDGRPTRLVFNYRTASTRPWGEPGVCGEWNYEAVYCRDDEPGAVCVEL